MFVSEYFHLSDSQVQKMNDMGVFDAILDKDSHFFINIVRLKSSSISEFIESYKAINNYFGEIATLLDAADNPTMDDVMYRTARKKFDFHEVNGINLGFSKSKYGAGFGKSISDQVLRDAYQIIKKGSKQPEIFHLVSLFEENVAGDRLSDMIATIIEPYIRQYTIRVMNELGINSQNYPDMNFQSDGLIHNPYKNSPILLLPKEILHKLPIAKEWDDIDRVVHENELIRKEISMEIGERWTKWATSEKKSYLKQHIFMEPAACSRVVNGYKNQKLDAYDVKENTNYFAEVLLKDIRNTCSFKTDINRPTSVEAARAIIAIFKDWIENNRGLEVINNALSMKKEKITQRLIHLAAKYYVNVNDLDFSCEADEGRGPADFKLSRGADKTVIEVKLSSNSQYIHGYQVQIKEYCTAEHATNSLYVLIDIGNPKRIKKISELHRKNQVLEKYCPELIIIDARPKKAASTYNENIDMECFSDVGREEINIDDMPDINVDGFDDLSTI